MLQQLTKRKDVLFASKGSLKIAARAAQPASARRRQMNAAPADGLLCGVACRAPQGEESCARVLRRMENKQR